MDRCVEALTGWQQRLGILLRYTGLRAGESMLLTWADVDLDQGTMIIRAETSKNKRGRRIALSPHLLAEMAGWGTREGYLIPSGRAKGPRHGSRSAYIDPWQALRLQEVVRLIPRIGTAKGKLVMVVGGSEEAE